LKTIAEIE
jgi:hypothetical protein